MALFWERHGRNDPIRSVVLERDDYRCQVCGESADLVVRQVFDGPRSAENCVTLCPTHNGRASYCKFVARVGVAAARDILKQSAWERAYLKHFGNSVRAFMLINNPEASDRREYFESNC